MKLAATLTMIFTPLLLAEPKKILVIGDSQSEEYRFEVPFSAPASDPFDSNTKNWIELLAEHRPEEVNFGEYRRNLLSYPDVRDAGFEYNWSIPGALTDTWIEVLNSSIFNDQEYLTSKVTLLGQIDQMDAVVIFLGGNDMNTVYSRLHRNEPPPNWPAGVIAQMEEIIDIIQAEDSSIPIIVGNFPDVGGTEKRKLDFPDKEGRELASQYIAGANSLLKTMLDARGIPVFEVTRVTTDLISDQPFRLGNVELLPFGNPENPLRNLLCRDGFHPSTSTQARLANMIILALNEAAGWSLTPFPDQEILTTILGLDPTIDDDYLAWIGGFQVSNTSLVADPDRDGLDNLGEFALNLNPAVPDAPAPTPHRTFNFTIAASRTNYVGVTPVISGDLENWTPFPTSPPFEMPAPYLRLEFFLLDNQ